MLKLNSKRDDSFSAVIENGGDLTLTAYNEYADFRLEIKRKPAPGKAIDQPFPIDMTREELLRLREGIEAMLMSAIQ